MREPVRLEVPADPRFFRLVTACVAELVDLAPSVANRSTVSHDLQLAVQELCVNIATHAYADRVDARLVLELTLNDQTFRADFHDTGVTFDPASVQMPRLDEGQVHGYGIFLIRSLVDDVSYWTEAGANHWRLIKRLV